MQTQDYENELDALEDTCDVLKILATRLLTLRLSASFVDFMSSFVLSALVQEESRLAVLLHQHHRHITEIGAGEAQANPPR